MEKDNIPKISLPKGGGSINGMGEKFQSNPATGTGSISIPISLSPGRSGFTPQLSLNYDSGVGNSPFGLGWNISIPSISRKTQRGIPTYQDEIESDTFLISEAEDLVPELCINEEGKQERVKLKRDGYIIYRYKPRIERLFSRIERWVNEVSGETHWRSITKDNITTIFGNNVESHISNPHDIKKTFQWLIESIYDDKGNVIYYEYKQEDAEMISLSLHERNRLYSKTAFTQKYLKKVKYGNTLPFLPRKVDFDVEKWDHDNRWLFEIIFDYGEHKQKESNEIPQYEPVHSWPCREDPFSNYRPGFEVRTYRLCQRILMFHHFEELGQEPYLVKSTELTQRPDPIVTLTTEITHWSYEHGQTPACSPPVTLKYSEPVIDEEVFAIDEDNIGNLPNGGTRQWLDLDGEGLSGILTKYERGWYYQKNLGYGHFSAPDPVDHIPSIAEPIDPYQFLADLGGDGWQNLVIMSPELSGHYEWEDPEAWTNFETFEHLPNINFQNPNLRMIDINGDGHPDLLITEDDCFTWYPSKAKKGYQMAKKVAKALDEEKGPTVIFSDGTESIYLTDMSGDGLTDIVRIRNGEICYWPNIGYAQFGAKITFSNSPVFDTPYQFDQKRIRLADIDGTGTTDILYLSVRGITYWLNQSGNSFSEKCQICHSLILDQLSNVAVTDLLGNGTACLVWYSRQPTYWSEPIKYLKLMSVGKPYLLIEMSNNIGSTTTLHYVASTHFYLEDQKAGKPWITKLPFPVHVLERTKVYDEISKNYFSSRYVYHHGYFDGYEREFRGFGMVEQWDTEDYPTQSDQNVISNWNEDYNVPPVYTKTWFHNGFYLHRNTIARLYEQEYYQGDPLGKSWLLPDTNLPEGLDEQEIREACRAMKGSLLRQEVYAMDNIPESVHPYLVTENSYGIRLIQSKHGNRHAVFFTYPEESLSINYERNPGDPRIAHSANLKIDDFGNVNQAVSVVYPRREPLYAEQAVLLTTCNENEVIHKHEEENYYRHSLPIETRQYEITGLSKIDNQRIALTYLKEACEDLNGDKTITYEAVPKEDIIQKRLIEHSRIVYYADDLSQNLPFGEIQSLAIPYETYTLSFSQHTLNQEELDGNIAGEYLVEGGYIQNIFPDQPDTWWTPSGIQLYDRPNVELMFYQPIGQQDPFGNAYLMDYDDYWLLTTAIIDPMQNSVFAQNDYRVLQPWRITDQNENVQEVKFDVRGMVIVSSIYGTVDNEVKGDSSLENYELVPVVNQEEIFEDSPDAFLQGASSYFYYDLFAFQNRQAPVNFLSIVREVHQSEQHENDSVRVQYSVGYSDGFGREIMSKVQAEDGEAPLRDVNGNLLRDDDGHISYGNCKDRWVGTGKTEYNNKGKPVKQYEPFFDSTYVFNKEIELVELGVSPLIHYDPMERVIRTDMPDMTFTKVEFTAWQQISYDQNDTVLDSEWFVDKNISPPEIGLNIPSDPDKRAAFLAAIHHNTPSVQHFDTLGRPFLTITHNRTFEKDDIGQIAAFHEEFISTRTILNIEGQPLKVIDALNPEIDDYEYLNQGNVGREVMNYLYTIDGQQIYQKSMDAGKRWNLNNVAGNPIYHFDERGHQINISYDTLQRALRTYVLKDQGNFISQRIVYGEELADAKARNLIGQAYLIFDGAGMKKNHRCDFKGNILNSSQKLARIDPPYQVIPDWSVLEQLSIEEMEENATPLLEADTFNFDTTYDALNRPVKSVTPDGSEKYTIYNKANFLETIKINIHGNVELQDEKPETILQNTELQTIISNIDYNAKGQRDHIDYGNGASTSYMYDSNTYRLIHLETTRTDASKLQDIVYHYDPVGNITEIGDEITTSVFHANEQINSGTKYLYDALYRLIEATGREHRRQNGIMPNQYDTAQVIGPINPNDLQAIRNYREKYTYDQVGNIKDMKHFADQGNWTRYYQYATAINNRLLGTASIANPVQWDNYTYDTHGNMQTMPHLQAMVWDHQDQLIMTDRMGSENEELQNKTWYTYDDSSQRKRKVSFYGNGFVKERIYLGELELYREYYSLSQFQNRVVNKERETLHVNDDTGPIILMDTLTREDDEEVVALTQFRYQINNHLGSTSYELDHSGEIISYEEYYPFGNTAYRSGRSQIEADQKRYRYTGKERDEETGLYYYGARYYAPWLGRWCSCDPGGLIDGVNVYVFVHDNPINRIDLNGNEDEYIDLGDLINVSELPGDAPDLVDTRKKIKPLNSPMTKKEARQYGNKQAHDYRKSAGLKGAEVQAGHTAAARHAHESGISKKDWDTQKMQRLHSRKGKGLDVEVKDNKGKTKIMTRHTSQEELIDDAVNRSKQPNGKLTPQGQLDAANEVSWRTKGTGMDQREVIEKRASGTFKEKKAINKISKKSGRIAKSGTKLLKGGAKAIPILGIGVGLYAAGDALSEGEYGLAALEMIGLIPGIGDYVDTLRLSAELGSVLGSSAYDIINPSKGTTTQLPQIFGDRKILRYKEGHIGGTVEFTSEEGQKKVISRERLCKNYNVCNL